MPPAMQLTAIGTDRQRHAHELPGLEPERGLDVIDVGEDEIEVA
jgi:hypothetical protein